MVDYADSSQLNLWLFQSREELSLCRAKANRIGKEHLSEIVGRREKQQQKQKKKDEEEDESAGAQQQPCMQLPAKKPPRIIWLLA